MVTESDLQNMSPEEIAEFQRKQCVFCKIINGEIPSKKVFEDDKLIGILDINPAVKGHALMMPKEHYPILPVIPLDVAAHMFRTTKHMVEALKNGMVTNIATVFMANGAIAGQQSPHFLYHLIPREAGDGLDNFSVPANDFKEEEIKQHLASLKGKIGLMMREYKAKKGEETKEEKPPEYKDLAEFIDKNPEIKNMIINNPEEFKKQLEANAELKKMFEGININKLSTALGQIKK
ncbi:HIT domain-containing protein [Candidatus Woesearchaeota archaeon]|nr:HIT domain-containing protein [Candidatus Woesearchaeota archaeon]